jgi:hypothetical protein
LHFWDKKKYQELSEFTGVFALEHQKSEKIKHQPVTHSKVLVASKIDFL